MICPWCNYENQPRAGFCGDCGRALEFDAVCASCSTSNPMAHRFCDACGTPIERLGPKSIAPTSVSLSTLLAPLSIPASNALSAARTRLRAQGFSPWEIATLAAIILSGLVLRLVSLTDVPPNLSGDEADNLQVVYRIMADTGPSFFSIDWTQTPAFNLYLISGFMGVFGETIVGLRMASVVLSTLSLPVFYFVARQYDVGKPAALAAAFLLATSLWYLHFSRSGWYNVHVALYALLALVTFTAALRRGDLRLYAAAGLFSALGLYAHPSGRMIVVALAAYLPVALVLYKENWKRVSAGYAVMLMTAFVLFLPHLNFALDNWESYNVRTKSVYVFTEQNRARFGDESNFDIIAEQTWNNVKGLTLLDPGASWVGLNARYIPGGHGFLDRFTSVLFWLGMAVSVLKWRHTLLWWVFFIIMLFPIQILSNATPDGGRAIGTASVFYLFVALGLHWLFNLPFAKRWWFWIPTVASLLIIGYFNVSGYFDWMDRPETAAARQPAVEVADFEVWQSLQKAEVQAGRPGFNVGEWLEMKEQGEVP